MMRPMLLLIAAAGCHPHLGKDFGKASRAGFSAQYTNLQGPAPVGPDGEEARLGMQRARSFGMPSDDQPQGGGQGFITPINLGGGK
jgi:hypothetical protein